MDDTLRNCLILIPALPLTAAVLVAVLGPRVLRGYSHWPVVLALLGSFICSVVLWREVAQRQEGAGEGGYEEVVTLWTWANVENAYNLKANPPAVSAADVGWRNFRIDVALRADALTVLRMCDVSADDAVAVLDYALARGILVAAESGLRAGLAAQG